jgi:hypothetical protein
VQRTGRARQTGAEANLKRCVIDAHIPDHRSRAAEGTARDLDGGGIEGAVVKERRTGVLRERSGTQRRARCNPDSPTVRESTAAREGIRIDRDRPTIGRIAIDRRRSGLRKRARLNVQRALGKAAVDLGGSSSGLGVGSDAVYGTAARYIERATVVYRGSILKTAATLIVERRAVIEDRAFAPRTQGMDRQV